MSDVSIWDDITEVDEEDLEETACTPSRYKTNRSRLSPLEARRAVEELMETRQYDALHNDFHDL